VIFSSWIMAKQTQQCPGRPNAPDAFSEFSYTPWRQAGIRGKSDQHEKIEPSFQQKRAVVKIWREVPWALPSSSCSTKSMIAK